MKTYKQLVNMVALLGAVMVTVVNIIGMAATGLSLMDFLVVETAAIIGVAGIYGVLRFA